MSVATRLQRALALFSSLRDVVEGRVETPVAPRWLERRGWAPFVLGLDDTSLGRAEALGLSTLLDAPGAPADLVELARELGEVTDLPRLERAKALDDEALRSVGLRKRAQLGALLAAVEPMAQSAERIVDVGAGSGHFTRLSAELFDREALGLEHDPARVASARRRAGARATFLTADARRGLTFTERDLAIGLHACGELGDHLVLAAGQARCDVALVPCCLQKIAAPTRTPLSQLGADAELGREHLGLANLTAQPRGVEADIEATIAARQVRYALGQLLRARGVALAPGAEMSGINRRKAHQGLAAVAERALSLRGLAEASAAELAEHEARAARDYGIIRRLSLPRSMLARLVEVLVALDRAAHLQEKGANVLVVALFSRAVSPRNIGIFGSHDPARLPAA
jgi:SAM-dependent methyltransferase